MMAKLTRKQLGHIRAALDALSDAERYIFREKTAVCHREQCATTTLHYTRADGSVLYEVEKEYGSHLCRLSDVKRNLERLLECSGMVRVQ